MPLYYLYLFQSFFVLFCAFQAYRLEPLIYDYYSEIPPVRLAKVGVITESASTASKQASAGSWLRGWFGTSHKNTLKTEHVEYKSADSQVTDLPKSSEEKIESILQGNKSEACFKSIQFCC